jgi:hypothetical protein
MEAHTPESIPDEVMRIAREHHFKIDVNDLDKRVRALPDIFSMPKTNLCYARAMAAKLRTKCQAAGRCDLVAKIDEIVADPKYDKIRAELKARNEHMKELLKKEI